jgi:hypothetical protein
VFAIGIQNINESYGEVKAYRGRISVALSNQPKSAAFTSSHDTSFDGTVGDADTADDGQAVTSDIENNSKRVLTGAFGFSSKPCNDDSAIAAKMDCNEFVIEALLKCEAIKYDRDLEPILNVSTVSECVRLSVHVGLSICLSCVCVSVSFRDRTVALLSLSSPRSCCLGAPHLAFI